MRCAHLETGGRLNKARSSTGGVTAGGLSRVVVVGELNVVQSNAAAGELWTAVEFDGHGRCGSAVDVLVGDVADLNPRLLARTIFVAGAVVLVDDDGVLHVRHHDLLEHDVPGEPRAGSAPRLDAHPILASCERRRSHRHVLHARLLRVLSQAPHADAVSGPARHVFDPQVGRSGPD